MESAKVRSAGRSRRVVLLTKEELCLTDDSEGEEVEQRRRQRTGEAVNPGSLAVKELEITKGVLDQIARKVVSDAGEYGFRCKKDRIRQIDRELEHVRFLFREEQQERRSYARALTRAESEDDQIRSYGRADLAYAKRNCHPAALDLDPRNATQEAFMQRYISGQYD